MKAIINHSQYSKSDYDYFKAKGYTNNEIIAKWDSEIGRNEPVVHTKKVDIVGYFTGKYNN